MAASLGVDVLYAFFTFFFFFFSTRERPCICFKTIFTRAGPKPELLGLFRLSINSQVCELT